jgi:predicted nucleic acid-binding protein
LSIYLDASVLVALMTTDPLTGRAVALMRGKAVTAVVSDFAVAEVVSAVARQVRTKEMTPDDARAVFSQLDSGSPHTRRAPRQRAPTYNRPTR